MRIKFKRYIIGLMMTVLMLSSSISVFATVVTAQDAQRQLSIYFQQGYAGNVSLDSKAGNSYKTEGGGYIYWTDLVDTSSAQTGYVNETSFNTLTSSSKQAFLEDLISISTEAVDDTTSTSGITTETQTDWLNSLQNCSGVGSQLMTTLLANTKPDYVTANKIYEPFSGVVGTVLGLGAILIMAFLAITMLLDISYIGIPAFRMLVDGDGGDNHSPNSKPKLISYEALSAVQLVENNGGTSSQNSSTNKLAIGIYFKKRVVMLVVLGICLLYLVQGQIFVLVGWILDLTSGFLGF